MPYLDTNGIRLSYERTGRGEDVLLIRGQNAAGGQLWAETAEAIPDCDFVEIPRCGHLGYLERPDEVNTAIVEFLDKH